MLNTININLEVKGTHQDLQSAKVFAIKHAGNIKVIGQKLTATFYCEETNYDEALEACMECINLQELEKLNTELVLLA